MSSRRAFLAGLLAAHLAPRASWADLGNPAFLSAGRQADGAYVLCGLHADGTMAFQVPLPARGHAAAAHPHLPEAVAFARRPGRFALVLDCRTGAVDHQLDAPQGRHFYGHGVFDPSGDLLFTTENDYAAARGVVGIWNARRGYRRIGEVPSGGVGPHDIRLLPDGETLVVANGGIETHPEAGRTKLNLPTMRASLDYLNLDGAPIEQITLGPEHQRNSIRHLAVAQDGTVAFAMQWQGDLTADLPLLGRHNRTTGALHLYAEAGIRQMNGYLGSVAITADGARLATTSPRAGRVQYFDQTGLIRAQDLIDVCGAVAAGDGFAVTTGTGLVRAASGARQEHPIAWDNHLVAAPHF